MKGGRTATCVALILALVSPSAAAAPAMPETVGPPKAAERETGDGENADEPETDAETPADEPAPDPMLDSLIEEATRHFKEGQHLFYKGEYAGAAAEFERSYAAIPSGDALRNVVLSHDRAGQPVQAIRAARRYLQLSDCGDEGADPIHCVGHRSEIDDILKKSLRLVGELLLVVDPGVEIREIRVAGRVVPREDFPVVIEPGWVEVIVSGPDDGDEISRVVRMRPGGTERFHVEPFDASETVEPETPVDPVEPRTSPEELERRRRALRTAFWTGLGLTIASGATMGVLGGLAVKTADDYKKGEQDHSTFPPLELEPRLARLRAGTNAMIAVTGVFGLATVALGLFAFSKAKPTNARASTTLRRFRVSPGGVRVRF